MNDSLAARAKLLVGDHTVGGNEPPFIIAEAGVHHANSVELAKGYILEARIAGAQAVKFQTYSADTLTTHWAQAYWAKEGQATQYDIFAKRSLLGASDYATLFAYAQEIGILLLSTPFNLESAHMLNDLGMVAFKIASAEITNLPLIREIAAFQKPVVMSTGASTITEIRSAVGVFEGYKCPLALLHCTLTYPTPLTDANLQRIALLRQHFPGLVIGYSDHTRPEDSVIACALAVGLGAQIVEKHFTLNRAISGDDHYHSVDPTGLAQLVADCHAAFLMTRPGPVIVESERAARLGARRSIVAAQSIVAGSVLGPGNIAIKRPGTGLPPSRVDSVIGRRTKRDIEADELICLEDLEDLI